VPRRLVPIRQRGRPARAAAARPGSPEPRLPDPDAGSKERRWDGALQRGAAGVHAALHDRRQRAHRAQRGGARSDPVPRDRPRRRIHDDGEKGPHGSPHRSLTTHSLEASMLRVNYLTVLGSAVVVFVLGWLWYSPLL